ncbi:MAG: hypothetical protein AABO41_06965 [Acidobacteriota bacterium]
MRYFEIRSTPEIKALFERARLRTITIADFCGELTGQGVNPIEHVLYVREAFGITLEEANRICTELEYGSVDNWADQMSDALDSLELEDEKGSE